MQFLGRQKQAAKSSEQSLGRQKSRLTSPPCSPWAGRNRPTSDKSSVQSLGRQNQANK